MAWGRKFSKSEISLDNGSSPIQLLIQLIQIRSSPRKDGKDP